CDIALMRGREANGGSVTRIVLKGGRPARPLQEIWVGARHDPRSLARVDIAFLVFVRAVDDGLAVVDIDAQAGAVGTHKAHTVGDRVEINRDDDATLEHF